MKYTYYKNGFYVLRMWKTKDTVYYQIHLKGVREWCQPLYMALSEWKNKGIKRITKEQAFLELL